MADWSSDIDAFEAHKRSQVLTGAHIRSHSAALPHSIIVRPRRKITIDHEGPILNPSSTAE